jgi:CPA1 family monovalent cation:H+ antiporter
MPDPELALLTLFAIATGVALVVRRLSIPYTVGLVVAGLAIGATHSFQAPLLTKELLFAVFLPGLLFEAAFNLDFSHFWHNRLAVFSLALPGVVASIAVTAALLTPVADALHFVQGFRFIDGLIFAALLAATDPIAVVGLFKSLGAPRRLGVLMEGESLLNDGTAVVFFTLILAVASGREASVGGAAVSFVRVVGVGVLVGAVAGLLASQVIHRVDEAMIEITVTTLAAYASFIGAERFGGSGVIATVVAGMICGNHAAPTGMSPTTRIAVDVFWQYVAFAFNSLVFLLMGFEVSGTDLLSTWRPILIAFLAVTLGRAIVVAGVTGLLRRSRERLPWRWAVALSWGGLRGALSMVLALSLGAEFPHRHLLVTMTFGVVILSILVQGLTMAPLLRWLRVVEGRDARLAYDRRRGELLAAQAAQAVLDELARERSVPSDVVETLRREYDERTRAAAEEVGRLHGERGDLQAHALGQVRRQLLLAEKNALARAARRDLIAEEAARELTAAVDARLVALAADAPDQPKNEPR